MIDCSDHCGATAEEPERVGWTLLESCGKWRCGACVRVLVAASSFPGTVAESFIDLVPRESRGALPKETASTIFPPVVSPHIN